MLYNRKLAQHFCVIHLQHALVDLAPTILDSRDIIEIWRMFKERPTLDVQDEGHSGEIHVVLGLDLDCPR